VRKNPQELAAAAPELDAAQLAAGDWAREASTARAVNATLAQLAARYLTLAKSSRGDGRQPLDPVARFHLGNGARLERINPLGDASAKGMEQSFGMMVNYVYDVEDLEDNVESFAREGSIATSATVRRQARQK
jgi:malonyl-CoA decarboxylase